MKEYPKQGSFLHRRTKVCFNYDTESQVVGTIVRDDKTEPGVLIIMLDDGRVVLSTECQYSPLKEAPERRDA